MKKISTLAQYEYCFSLQTLNHRRVGFEEETEDPAPPKKKNSHKFKGQKLLKRRKGSIHSGWDLVYSPLDCLS